MTQLDRPATTVSRPPATSPKGGPPWYRTPRWWIVGTAALALVVGGVLGGLVATSGTTGAATAPGPSTTAPTGTTGAPTASTTAPGGAATTPAPGTVAAALGTALVTEEEAKATYDNVIARFGTVAPFSAISSAEAQHIDTVRALAQRYGVTLPAGPFAGQPAPATFAAACQLGMTTEQEVVATYDQLLAQVSGASDLTQAFSNLQAAAGESHLPAFEHCR